MLTFKSNKRLREAFDVFAKGSATTYHSYIDKERDVDKDSAFVIISDDTGERKVEVLDIYICDDKTLMVKVSDGRTVAKRVKVSLDGVRIDRIRKLVLYNIAAGYGFNV